MRRIVAIILSICSCSGLSAQVSIQDTLQLITVLGEVPLNENQIRHDSTTMAMEDILQKEASIQLRDYGPGSSSTVSIRGGSAEQTQVVWNGIPQNSPTLGSTDISLIPLFFIQCIALHDVTDDFSTVRPASAGVVSLSSADTYTGLRMLKTYTPLTQENETGISYAYKVGETQFNSALFMRTAENAFPYSYRNSTGWNQELRENAQEELVGLHQGFSWERGSNNLDLHLEYINSERNIPAALYSTYQGDEQLDQLLRTSLSIKAGLWRGNLGYTMHDQRYDTDLFALPSIIETRRTFASLARSVIQSEKADLEIISRADHSSAHLSMNSMPEVHSISLTLSGRIHLTDQWRVSALLDQTVTSQGSLEPSPLVSLSYSSSKKEKELKVSIGRSFRQPTLNEMHWPNAGNKDIRVEESYNSMIEFHPSFIDGLQITVFNTNYADLIRWMPRSDGLWSPENVYQMTNRGFEIDYEKTVLQSAILGLNYHYLNSAERGEEETVWMRSLYRPKHRTAVFMDIPWRNNVIKSSWSYNSEMLTDRIGGTVSHYSQWNVGFVHKVQELTLELGLNNILDRQNELVRNRPLVGRHLKIIIQYHI